MDDGSCLADLMEDEPSELLGLPAADQAWPQQPAEGAAAAGLPPMAPLLPGGPSAAAAAWQGAQQLRPLFQGKEAPVQNPHAAPQLPLPLPLQPLPPPPAQPPQQGRLEQQARSEQQQLLDGFWQHTVPQQQQQQQPPLQQQRQNQAVAELLAALSDAAAAQHYAEGSGPMRASQRLELLPGAAPGAQQQPGALPAVVVELHHEVLDRLPSSVEQLLPRGEGAEGSRWLLAFSHSKEKGGLLSKQDNRSPSLRRRLPDGGPARLAFAYSFGGDQSCKHPLDGGGGLALMRRAGLVEIRVQAEGGSPGGGGGGGGSQEVCGAAKVRVICVTVVRSPVGPGQRQHGAAAEPYWRPCEGARWQGGVQGCVALYLLSGQMAPSKRTKCPELLGQLLPWEAQQAVQQAAPPAHVAALQVEPQPLLVAAAGDGQPLAARLAPAASPSISWLQPLLPALSAPEPSAPLSRLLDLPGLALLPAEADDDADSGRRNSSSGAAAQSSGGAQTERAPAGAPGGGGAGALCLPGVAAAGAASRALQPLPAAVSLGLSQRCQLQRGPVQAMRSLQQRLVALCAGCHGERSLEELRQLAPLCSAGVWLTARDERFLSRTPLHLLVSEVRTWRSGSEPVRQLQGLSGPVRAALLHELHGQLAAAGPAAWRQLLSARNGNGAVPWLTAAHFCLPEALLFFTEAAWFTVDDMLATTSAGRLFYHVIAREAKERRDKRRHEEGLERCLVALAERVEAALAQGPAPAAATWPLPPGVAAAPVAAAAAIAAAAAETPQQPAPKRRMLQHPPLQPQPQPHPSRMALSPAAASLLQSELLFHTPQPTYDVQLLKRVVQRLFGFQMPPPPPPAATAAAV